MVILGLHQFELSLHQFKLSFCQFKMVKTGLRLWCGRNRILPAETQPWMVWILDSPAKDIAGSAQQFDFHKIIKQVVHSYVHLW